MKPRAAVAKTKQTLYVFEFVVFIYESARQIQSAGRISPVPNGFQEKGPTVIFASHHRKIRTMDHRYASVRSGRLPSGSFGTPARIRRFEHREIDR
jgi:hypothetical protein